MEKLRKQPQLFLWLSLLSLLLVGGVWSYQQHPHLPVRFGVPTEVRDTLQYDTATRQFYLETSDHIADHRLILVNSYQPLAIQVLTPFIHHRVHLFGTRDAADSDDFLLLWMNGRTLMQETDGLFFFQGVSFRSFFNHASPTFRQCLVTAWTQAEIDRVMKSRAEQPTSDELHQVDQCTQEELPRHG